MQTVRPAPPPERAPVVCFPEARLSWPLFAFLTAFFESGKDVFAKLCLQRCDEYLVAWAWRLLALPFLLPLIPVVGVPPLGAPFWGALLVSGGLNVVTAVLYVRAIRLSDLSLTVPMVALTPLFLLLSSPLILGEFPGPVGLAGVLLIVAGSYLLYLGQRSRGVLAPLRALLGDSGPRLMLLVALLWSITANVDKIGLRHSSPTFWALAVNLFIACAMLPLVLRRRGALAGMGGSFAPLLGLCFCGAMTSLCQMTAISMALVPYVISIKRTSTVLSVLWGHFLFGEQGFRERLAGTCIMVAGAVMITLGQGR